MNGSCAALLADPRPAPWHRPGVAEGKNWRRGVKRRLWVEHQVDQGQTPDRFLSPSPAQVLSISPLTLLCITPSCWSWNLHFNLIVYSSQQCPFSSYILSWPHCFIIVLLMNYRSCAALSPICHGCVPCWRVWWLMAVCNLCMLRPAQICKSGQHN